MTDLTPEPVKAAQGEPRFDAWIDTLIEDVVQDEYGYEPGEFTVYAEQWRPLYTEGLTPQQAFRRALDGFGQERAEAEAAKKENWVRIQREDASAIVKAQSHDHT